MDNFDPDSPLLIAQGTLTLAVLGSATGATLAAFKAQNPFVLGMNMGLNGGIAGLAFFGIREYIVSPVLLLTLSGSSPSYHARRISLSSSASFKPFNEELEQDGSSSTYRGETSRPATTNSNSDSGVGEGKALNRVRNDRVLDSALAGGLTGGIISGAFRGRKTIPRAFITSTLMTALGQYVVNNGRVVRLEVLARRSARDRDEEGRRGMGGMTDPAMSSTSQASQAISNTAEGTGKRDFPSISTRLVDFFRSLSPVRKISDSEYLRILERQRDEMQRDMRAWEEKMRGKYAGESTTTTRDGEGAVGAGSKQAAGTGQTIDMGQLYRQLDSVERRIKGLEGKIAGEGPEAAGRV